METEGDDLTHFEGSVSVEREPGVMQSQVVIQEMESKCLVNY